MTFLTKFMHVSKINYSVGTAELRRYLCTVVFYNSLQNINDISFATHHQMQNTLFFFFQVPPTNEFNLLCAHFFRLSGTDRCTNTIVHRTDRWKSKRVYSHRRSSIKGATTLGVVEEITPFHGYIDDVSKEFSTR